jgi:hypothetical protein
MKQEQFEMVIECTDSYHAELLEDGRTKITIVIPKGFRWLWLSKLGELRTTMEEITHYRSYDEEELKEMNDAK